MRLVLQTFSKDDSVFPGLLFYLVYLRLLKGDSYARIKTGGMDINQLTIAMSDNDHVDWVNDYLNSVRAQVIFSYWKESWKQRFIHEITFDSYLDKLFLNNSLALSRGDLIKHTISLHDTGSNSIGPLSDYTNRIDLVEPLRTSNNP